MRTIGPGGIPLLESKLTVPDRPPSTVDRPRLTGLLDAAAAGPVTVLCAPAGWGKTVLLSSWLASGGPPYPAAWLTLEPDDEGHRFWAYLHKALLCAGVQRSEAPPPPEPGATAHGVYLARLATALATLAEPVLVILDDFHTVPDPNVRQGLQFLLRHAAGRFRLVIATRVEPALPLHRWRLDGELTELRSGELAFTAAESADLLARHDLVRPDEDLEALHRRTEGWPAGVRLAALSLQGEPDPGRAIEQFTGEQPAIAQYLDAEVLSGQPDELRETLLRTSVLDRVCGGLADALTGRVDGERLLGDLRQAPGFLVPLGGEPAWYRCHRLFGDLLNAELSRWHPDAVPDLHRRAAAWFAAHGGGPEALRHLMAAGDWQAAAGVLSRHWPALTLCGHGEAERTPLPPLPPQAVAADPALALAYATDRLDVADLDGADAYLRLAERHQQVLGDDRSAPFAAMVAGCRLAWAQLHGDLEEVMSSAHQLLALSRRTPDNADTPDRDGRDCRTIALTALATTRLSLGDVSGAHDALTDAVREAQQATSCARRACTGALALFHAERGDLRSAESAARAALAMAPCAGRRCAGHAAPAHVALAIVHYHRDRLTDAGRCLDQAADVRHPAAPALTATISILRSMILRDRGDLGRGCELLLAGRRALHERQRNRHLEHWFAAAEAELRLAHGDAAGARELLVHTLAEGTERSARLAVSLARACLQDGDPGAAARVLPTWSDGRTTAPFLALQLDAGLVAARAARELGDHHGATRTLERVLDLAEPDDYRRIFTRGGTPVRDLLAAHLDAGTAHWLMVRRLIDVTTPGCADDPPRPSGVGEPLTERELTVLRYLQGMLSNGEIASELYLSVNTVKTHVRNIYQKLGTPRRREAVRRARELRLL